MTTYVLTYSMNGKTYEETFPVEAEARERLADLGHGEITADETNLAPVTGSIVLIEERTRAMITRKIIVRRFAATITSVERTQDGVAYYGFRPVDPVNDGVFGYTHYYPIPKPFGSRIVRIVLGVAS